MPPVTMSDYYPTHNATIDRTRSPRRLRMALSLLGSVLAASTLVLAQPGRVGNAHEWLKQSARAMGGETVLRELSAIDVSGISVLYHREQSERPEGPWVPTFTEFNDVRHLRAGVVRRTSRTRGYLTEDAVAWSAESAIMIVDGVGTRKTDDRFASASLPWDVGAMPLAHPARADILAITFLGLKAGRHISHTPASPR
jgi:hypothetical protein